MGWKTHGKLIVPADYEPRTVAVRGRYDAAQTTDDNRKHWAYADGMSAASKNSLAVRSVLRNRARYERDNNDYCKAGIKTFVNHLVGTGPRLQVRTDDDALNRRIERRWGEWCEAVGFADTLQTLVGDGLGDGEGFAVFKTDSNVVDDIPLNVVPVACDRFSTATAFTADTDRYADGITYDDNGRPISYEVLDTHPGETGVLSVRYGASQIVPAQYVLHWYTVETAGQRRGIPAMTASLPLFALQRRFTLATLTAAETAASFSALLETELGPDDAALVSASNFQTLEIVRNMLMMLPKGYKMHQFAAEHPQTTFRMFKQEILKELARGFLMPYNLFAGDSSDYNLSSARMDVMNFRLNLIIVRDKLRRWIVERVFRAWYRLAVLARGYIDAPRDLSIDRAWYWPGFESIDPLKDAQADTERLRNGTATLEEILAEYGQDWRAFIRQRGEEIKQTLAAGIPLMGEGNRNAANDQSE